MKVILACLFFLALANAQAHGHNAATHQNLPVFVVRKDSNPKVDGMDRLLYDINELESIDPNYVNILENEKMSRSDLVDMVTDSLGENWADFVSLPDEDLTLLEVMRLSTSLNEINYDEASNGRQARNPPGGGGGGPNSMEQGVCFCHGTARTWPDGNVHTGDKPSGQPTFKKDYPFMGIRMWKKSVPGGHANNPNNHNDRPYNNTYRDCLLGEGTTENYYRRCCTGGCVITGNGVVVGLPHQDIGLDYYCDTTSGPLNLNRINQYQCGRKCHTDCACGVVKLKIESESCPLSCDEDYLLPQEGENCECADVLKNDLFECDCDERNDIIELGFSDPCGCKEAVQLTDGNENGCVSCDKTIDALFATSGTDNDGCCPEYMAYVDVRDRFWEKKSCDCSDENEKSIIDYGFCSCCEAFDLAKNPLRNPSDTAFEDETDNNVEDCQAWALDGEDDPDGRVSHAAWIAGTCTVKF